MNIDPKLIDVFPDDHDGYPVEFEAEDNAASYRDAAGDTARDFPDHLWIEPREWKEFAAEAKANKTRPIDYMDRFTNQGGGNGIRGTHECTCHALEGNALCAMNRQKMQAIGPPEPKVFLPASRTRGSVWLSCVSIYAEANPRQWGGANVRQVMEIAVDRGFLPDKIQPKEYNFKHDLIGTCGAGNVTQSRGSWVSVNQFPDGWKETARHFRPLEIIIPTSYEQCVCLVLHGRAVSVGRSGHAVVYSFWDGEERVMGYRDSYDVIRYDSERTVKGCARTGYSIATMVMPDNYDLPAG